MRSIQFTKTVQAKNATFYYDGVCLMKSVLNDEVELELEDILEQRKICQDLSQGKPHVILVIAGKSTMATKEAREYAAMNSVPGRLAEAIIINSMPVRLMGNVYINYHKPKVPTKMFGKEEDAIEWLDGIYKEHMAGKQNG